MQIVIDIDEELYEIIKDPNKLSTMYHASKCAEAVRNGIPIPKEYGKLADVDAIIDSLKGIEKLHIDDELRNNILNDLYANTLETDKGE